LNGFNGTGEERELLEFVEEKMDRNLYFLIADFIDPPPCKERSSIEFSYKRDDMNKFPCGNTIVNFGQEEVNLLLFTFSESAESARENLMHFAQQQRLKIMPMNLDWTKARILVHDLKVAVKGRFQVESLFGDIKINQSTVKRLKEKIHSKIAQNKKWDRKFQKVMKYIVEFERKPSEEIGKRILDECFYLSILS